MFPTDERTDRGQLIILIGLVVGLALVVLALVLNAAIFTENLSTRESVDSEESSTYSVDAETAIEGIYGRTNANETRKARYANESFNESLEVWADDQADNAAQEGAVFEAEWTPFAGWRLEQDTNGSFTPADDDSAESWTLATDARDVSALELNVSRDDLYDSATTDAFHLVVSDGSPDWKLYVYQDGSDMKVSEGDPSNSSSEQCSRTTDSAVIDVRNGTFDGSDCSALDPAASLADGGYEIRFENVQNSSSDTEHVNGTYAVAVNGSNAIATNSSDYPTRFNVSGKASPTATAVVYAVEYDTYYQRSDVTRDVEDEYAPRAETV